MKNLKRYFALVAMLFISVIVSQVHAGPGGSKLSSAPKKPKPSMPRSPSYGDTALGYDDGYLTLPVDARFVIPIYQKAKKTLHRATTTDLPVT
ncbi:MAG: hypothetical protein IKE41_00065, partial [Clostridia bacterium]|nr:hypothetical protein [Clostridia bacterium]